MKTRFAFALWLLSGVASFGSSRPTVEQSAIHLLSVSFSFCAETNSGILPNKWEQLSSFDFTYWNRALLNERLGTIQGMYVFAPSNLTLLLPRKGRVIIARCHPLEGSGTEGRYIICHDPEKDPIMGIRSDWVSESEFQAMLKLSNITLPAPDPAEIRAAEEAVKQAMVEEERVRQIARQNAPRPALTERWTVLQERIKGIFIKPTSDVASGGSPGQSQGVLIHSLAIALTALLLIGGGFLAIRFMRRRHRTDL